MERGDRCYGRPLGGLGLAAGTVLWLALRELVPSRIARILWSGLIIVIVVTMAFLYREVA